MDRVDGRLDQFINTDWRELGLFDDHSPYALAVDDIEDTSIRASAPGVIVRADALGF